MLCRSSRDRFRVNLTLWNMRWFTNFLDQGAPYFIAHRLQYTQIEKLPPEIFTTWNSIKMIYMSQYNHAHNNNDNRNTQWDR